jgi:hypothetical protein
MNLVTLFHFEKAYPEIPPVLPFSKGGEHLDDAMEDFAFSPLWKREDVKKFNRAREKPLPWTWLGSSISQSLNFFTASGDEGSISRLFKRLNKLSFPDSSPRILCSSFCHLHPAIRNLKSEICNLQSEILNLPFPSHP